MRAGNRPPRRLIPTCLAASLLAATLAAPAAALEYRSTSRPAVLYDAPSTAAGKLAIAGPGLPLELVVDTEAWVKVRDHSGRLAWIEKSALGGGQTVIVKRDAAVRQQPRTETEVVFRAAAGILLAVTGPADAYGWLPVRHAGGLGGWVPANEVWGR